MTFDIWGDAVNTAWFMERSGVAGRINVRNRRPDNGHGYSTSSRAVPSTAKHEPAPRECSSQWLKKQYSRNGDGHLCE